MQLIYLYLRYYIFQYWTAIQGVRTASLQIMELEVSNTAMFGAVYTGQVKRAKEIRATVMKIGQRTIIAFPPLLDW